MIDSLKSEISDLRDENARLRSDEQRTLDPHAVAAELHDLTIAASLQGGGADGAASDDHCRELLDLEVVRQGLIEVCTRLQVLSGQLHRQLSEGAPAPEIDRRVANLDDGHARRREDRRLGNGAARNGNTSPNGNASPNGNTSPNGNGKPQNGNGKNRTSKADSSTSRNGKTRTGKNRNGKVGTGGSGRNGDPRNGSTVGQLNWGTVDPSNAAAIRKVNRNRRGHP